MNTQSVKTNSKDILILAFIAMLITSFLFFIDEGYYDFRWTKNPGNWLVFFIYAAPIFLLELLSYSVFLKRYNQGAGKLALSVFIGTTLGLMLVMGIIFGAKS